MSALGRVLAITAVIAACAAGIYYLSETRRLGVRIDHLMTRNRALEAQLNDAIAERQRIHAMLAEKAEEFGEARLERAESSLAGLKPMPEGVRLALIAVNECLREDGFPEIRFLQAAALSDRALQRAEIVEADRASLLSHLYIAGEVRLRLDRDEGVLVVRLLDGYKLSGSAREPFPESGYELSLANVEGPMWEGRLGYLLEVVGSYPIDLPKVPRESLLDRDQRASWLGRFDRLLEDAGTHVRYRVQKLEGLDRGVFTGIVLLGYDENRNLASAIEAARLQVVTDARHGTVELFLEDGVLRKESGEASIPADGYRLLLPKITRDRAMDVMLGMVSQR